MDTATNSNETTQNLRAVPECYPGAIDSLAIQLPTYTFYHPEFEEKCRQAGFRSSPKSHYYHFADLRGVGVPVTFYRNQHSSHTHKIELHGVGHMSAIQICGLLKDIVMEDPLEFKVMRVDLAADVPGVPVTWFRTHVSAKYKRHHPVYGRQQIAKIADSSRTYPSFEYETLSHGKKNRFQIYDKVEELEELVRTGNISDADARLLDLYRASARCWTRVERECVGRVPEQLTTLGKLFSQALNFNPFDSIDILPGDSPLPREEDYSWGHFLTGYAVRKYIEDNGIQKFRTSANRKGGHAKQYLENFKEFLPENPEGFQPPDLLELYKAGVMRQFGAVSAHSTVLLPSSNLAGQASLVN